MAIKVRYNYSDYKGFPAATEASRAFNARFAIISVLFIPLVFIIAAFLSQYVGFIIALIIALIIAVGLIYFVRMFYAPFIIRKIINSLDLTDDLKKTAIACFTKGRIWGKVDIDSAYKFAYSFSHLTYQYKSGELSTEEYKEKRKPFLKSIVSDTELASVLNTDLAEIEPYYFENNDEYNIFLRDHVVNSSFHWESKSTKYTEMLIKADILLEEGNAKDAVEIYRKALSINPVAIKARYGMVACYSAMGQANKAKEEMLKMSHFFTSNTDIARYYRQLGYSLIETGEYEAAYACYKYSQFFEETDIAFEGMTVIEEETGRSFSSMNSEEVLKDYNYLSYRA